jgi:cysteine sulfinate desulfinase/cysteine desulfurase-like protein
MAGAVRRSTARDAPDFGLRPSEKMREPIRFSLGRATTEDEIDTVVDALTR